MRMTSTSAPLPATSTPATARSTSTPSGPVTSTKGGTARSVMASTLPCGPDSRPAPSPVEVKVMFALVLAIVLAAAGFVLLRLKDHPKKLSRYAAIPFALALFLDAGEAAVTKTFGTVGDEAISATGIHLKAPWQDLIRFDIRNQTIALDEGGGRISTVTSDNATVAYDVTIRYSLNPGKLSEIVRQYPDQESFISRAVLPGVSSVTRDAPTTFTAATVRQSRAQLALRITEGLEKRLGEVGVTVEQVDPRAITLDQSVQANYDKVQSSLANAEAAKADLQTALAKAEITKTEAQRSE